MTNHRDKEANELREQIMAILQNPNRWEIWPDGVGDQIIALVTEYRATSLTTFVQKLKLKSGWYHLNDKSLEDTLVPVSEIDKCLSEHIAQRGIK